ncbi:MAG: tetratricopeptide repeat protein, partial [Myxococcota bacterium]|nr:tetratricopeptide repeat protein [Myxococcota bacterium]
AVAIPILKRACAALGGEGRVVTDKRLECVSALTTAYVQSGRFDEATPLNEGLLTQTAGAKGAAAGVYVKALRNRALIERASGAEAQAERQLVAALKVGETAFGSAHPELRGVLRDLAVTRARLGRYAQAHTALARLIGLDNEQVDRVLLAGTEVQVRASLLESQATTHLAVSAALASPGDDSGALAFDTLLHRKGRALDAGRTGRRWLEDNVKGPDRARLDALKRARARLARLEMSPPVGMTRAAVLEERKRLAAETDALAGALSRESLKVLVREPGQELSYFAYYKRYFLYEEAPTEDAVKQQRSAAVVTASDVSAALPEGASLIGYVVYRRPMRSGEWSHSRFA